MALALNQGGISKIRICSSLESLLSGKASRRSESNQNMKGIFPEKVRLTPVEKRGAVRVFKADGRVHFMCKWRPLVYDFITESTEVYDEARPWNF